jgi:hypothetical protein
MFRGLQFHPMAVCVGMLGAELLIGYRLSGTLVRRLADFQEGSRTPAAARLLNTEIFVLILKP